MHQKTIISLTLVVLVIVGLMVWGRTNAAGNGAPNHAGAPQGAGTSALTASELRYDFGTISMRNGLVSHTFTVTNATAATIDLASVYTSCMCTSAYLETPSGEKGPFGMEGMGYVPPANETIAPGESRTVKVVYNPNAHGPAGVGDIDRFVYLVDTNGRALTLEIRAVVTP